ncbi:MAG: methyltransferase domain-containing protein [Sulfuricurvum sp.]|nr:methyltransferase domain-containing protein [Sulfuricurvum sp.]
MDDKTRWNAKHQNVPMPNSPSNIVIKNVQPSHGKRALDIACGTGRNTHYLAKLGYEVDAVDISDYALSQIDRTNQIHTIESDLTNYSIASNSYDLIININYLERKLFSSMIEGLTNEGILIFETFITAHEAGYHNPSNPDFLLRSNELPTAFSALKTLFYEERDNINMYGEKVKIASYIGQK